MKYPACITLLKYLVIHIVIIHLSFSSTAQNYNYVHYTTKDGLAGSIVYSMVQDHDGFIWFGTESGLSRFDGTHFRNFTSADGLPDNEIIKLFVDSKNRVWAMPFKSALCYYWNGTIHNAENDSLVRQLNIKNDVFCMVENAKGDIAILSYDQIKILKADGKITTVDTFAKKIGASWYMGGLKDKNTFQFAVNIFKVGRFVYELGKDGLKMKNFLNSVTLNNLVTSVYLSPDLEIAPNKNNLEFSMPGTGEKSKIPIPDGFIMVNRINDSLVAINNSSFVQIYNYRRHKSENIVLEGKNVNSTMEDLEGNLWFSTMEQGVYRLASKEFKSYQFLYKKNNLPVFVLKKYGDTLYAGTDHFLLWTVNTLSGTQISRQLFKSVSIGRITTIDKNEYGLFVGCDIGFMETNSQKRPVYPNTSAVKSTFFYSDSILIAFNNGTVFRKSQNLLFNKEVIKGRSTAVYKQGSYIYVGTLNGLYVVDAYLKPLFLGNLNKVLAGRIVDIRGSADGTIWIATHGDGVAGYKDGKIVALLNQQNGLTSNICNTLFVTGKALWVGTDKGMNKVDILNGNYQVTRYTMSDGLISDAINTLYVDKNIVYAGTPEGVSFFDESKAFTRSMCVLKITGIQSASQKWQHDTTDLQFDHYDNNIRFEFAGISFKSGGDITYHHRLIGLEGDWQTSRENFLSYPALTSGEYELQVMAINKFGVQSNTVSTRFTIAKLLWEKTWFRLLVILFAGAVVWILVNQRIKRIRGQEKDKMETSRKIAELEQMALKSQMNPHFIFNCLNSIQQYVIDKDVRGANKFITEFARLIRLTLEISSLSGIRLDEEINYISTYLELEKTRFENKFNYRIHVADDVSMSKHIIPPMILQPYIENSIRHGIRYRGDKEGLITIDFSIYQANLVCIITDNGVGRNTSQQLKGSENIEYQSKGMSLTARRIEMLNKNYIAPIFIEVEDILKEDNICGGTKITISFPVQATLPSS